MDLSDPKIYSALKQKLSDKAWRMNNLYFVKDKDGKKVRFTWNRAQSIYHKNKHNKNVILKARQLGFTTDACIDALDNVLFNPFWDAGIIADNRENAEKIFTNKIKFAYDNLPEVIKNARVPNTDRAGELRFANGSSISVSTGYRGGTLMQLHVSEFGKICAKYPDKAIEIVAGAFNAVPKDGQITIESTAEGKVGKFFEICEQARANQRLGTVLTPMDYKFHFFPWHEDPEYRLDPKNVLIQPGLADYFKDLDKSYGIKLDDEQKAWYAKKSIEQGEDMLKEYPSHPDEAFAQSVDGAYYGKQMAQAETEKRIGKVPWEPMLKVHTAWDLGLDDNTSIWFFQVEPGGARRYIDYYTNNGEQLSHYVKILREKPYTYGRHVLPHDVEVGSLQVSETRKETLNSLGLWDIEVVASYPGALADGIDAVRRLLPKCWFDQTKCHDGIKNLKEYRKAWDEKAGVWKDKPLHDASSHGADSFRMSAMIDIKDIPAPTQTRAVNRHR